jgi:hypothetical protein
MKYEFITFGYQFLHLATSLTYAGHVESSVPVVYLYCLQNL